jgi:hypothetical protein
MESRRCARCGADAKVFPDDFPNTRQSYWPSAAASARDGPASGRPVVVCASCGHNEDLPGL